MWALPWAPGRNYNILYNYLYTKKSNKNKQIHLIAKGGGIMSDNKTYIDICKAYRAYCSLPRGITREEIIYDAISESVKKAINQNPTSRLQVLDFACGDGERTIQTLRWFMPEWYWDFLIFGYDKNQDWMKHWQGNMVVHNHSSTWKKKAPTTFEGIIHFSHAVYIPEARKQVFDIFKNSPNCPMLIIRAMSPDCVITEVTKAWDIKGVYNWQDVVMDWVRKNDYRCFEQDVEIGLIVPGSDLANFANLLQGFISGAGEAKIAIDIMRNYLGPATSTSKQFRPKHVKNRGKVRNQDISRVATMNGNDKLFIITKK
jgi:hypothetical protein